MASGLVLGGAALVLGGLGYLAFAKRKASLSGKATAAHASGCASGTKAGKADASSGAVETLANPDDPTLLDAAKKSGDKASWMKGYWSCYQKAYKDTDKPSPSKDTEDKYKPPPSKSPGALSEAAARSSFGSGCSAGFGDGWREADAGKANEGRLGGLFAGLHATKGHAYAAGYQQGYRNGWSGYKVADAFGGASTEPDGEARASGVSGCSSGFDAWWSKYGAPSVAGSVAGYQTSARHPIVGAAFRNRSRRYA